MCLALPKSLRRTIPPAAGHSTTNDQNQITSIGSANPAYDSNGNITKDDHGDTLVYDAWNRLAAVYNASGVLLAGYTYDGYGRMTSETNVTTTTDFYYSGTQDIQERTGVTDDTGASLSSNGTTTLVNVYSPDYVNDILLRDEGGTRVYFTHDANFNVTGVVQNSTTATMLQRMAYDAYGAVKFYNASWTLQGGDSLSLRNLYQGMRYDATIRWYLTGQTNHDRWYSPTMDVWNREDSAGDVNGLNEYGFVADNPISGRDPTGLVTVLGFEVGAVSAGVVDQINQAIENGDTAQVQFWLQELGVEEEAARQAALTAVADSNEAATLEDLVEATGREIQQEIKDSAQAKLLGTSPQEQIYRLNEYIRSITSSSATCTGKPLPPGVTVDTAQKYLDTLKAAQAIAKNGATNQTVINRIAELTKAISSAKTGK